MFCSISITRLLSSIESIALYSEAKSFIHCISQPHNIYPAFESFFKSLLYFNKIKHVGFLKFYDDVNIAVSSASAPAIAVIARQNSLALILIKL